MIETGKSWRFRGFGLVAETTLDLPGIAVAASDEPTVEILTASREDLARAFSGPDGRTAHAQLGEGHLVRFELGRDGDLRVDYADNCFHVDAPVSRILCAPGEFLEFGWRRQLLDTVLHTASFMRGFELLHACSVTTSVGAVAIAGPSGAGKSSLLAELMLRGHRLLADDVLALRSDTCGVWGLPAPAVMNLPDQGPAPASLGAVPVSHFAAEKEIWGFLPEACLEAAPLRRVFLLDPRSDDAAVRDGGSLIDLLPLMISLPHSPTRAAARFAALADVVERVGISRLGRLGRRPDQIADTIEAWL